MKTTVTEFRPEPSEAEIQKAAYFLWLELGRPEGRDLETWLTAKESLRHHWHPGATHNPPTTRRRSVRASLSI